MQSIFSSFRQSSTNRCPLLCKYFAFAEHFSPVWYNSASFRLLPICQFPFLIPLVLRGIKKLLLSHNRSQTIFCIPRFIAMIFPFRNHANGSTRQALFRIPKQDLYAKKNTKIRIDAGTWRNRLYKRDRLPSDENREFPYIFVAGTPCLSFCCLSKVRKDIRFCKRSPFFPRWVCIHPPCVLLSATCLHVIPLRERLLCHLFCYFGKTKNCYFC